MEVVGAPERDAVYDVQLRRQPPESLRSRFPSMKVRTTPAQTALRREVGNPSQLDALLQELRSVGLVVTDLHRLNTRSPGQRGGATATYEVRVRGELGTRLLRSLHCSHYVVPEQTMVRLSADPDGLTGFLHACTDCGAHIERVSRVGVAPDQVAAKAG